MINEELFWNEKLPVSLLIETVSVQKKNDRFALAAGYLFSFVCLFLFCIFFILILVLNCLHLSDNY